MPIYFCGDTSIDNYEFYGVFQPLLTQYADWNGSSKITVRRFGGIHLLALFTTFAWSLFYGATRSRSEPIKELQPATDFYRQQLLARETELYLQPRNYDHFWQFSYQLDKCGDEYRVPRRGHVGVTAPTDMEKSPEVMGKEQLCLNTGNEAKLFIVNYRKPYASGAFYSIIKAEHQKLADDIARERDAWTIIKVRDPPTRHDDVPLLSTLVAQNPEKVIVIILAEDFRKLGMPLSRSLSWEATLRDIIEQARAGTLLPGKMPSHIIITFDYDAALYLKTKPNELNAEERVIESGTLIFSVGGAEGDFENSVEGDMPGAQTVFVSMLSTLLYKKLADKVDRPLEQIDIMLECALLAKRRLLQSGFVIVDEQGRPFHKTQTATETSNRVMPRVLYSEGIFSLQKTLPHRGDRSSEPPNPLIDCEDKLARREFLDPFKHMDELQLTLSSQELATYKFQNSELPDKGWLEDWSIFKKVNDLKNSRRNSDRPTSKEGSSDPAQYVIGGVIPKDVPVCSFGKIKTVDVREIEDFRTIANLLESYLSDPLQAKPLGIAIFGPPGAGKSFAVKNIIETLPDQTRKLTVDDRLECNLAALSDPEDLAHYFQLARNSVLRGKVPMLFFDEFDCTVGNFRFFWLKHFLAPLQDGEFRSGQIVHPLGRVIFCFAGSVSENFENFSDVMEANRSSAEGEPAVPGEPNFKGVDFLSRLHGHIDVAPFTPKDGGEYYYACNKDKRSILVDPSYLMRRAFVLRGLLELHLRQIFSRGSPPKANVDAKIVNALLATRTFLYGARSMESILRMSCLEGGDRFEISHLPPDRQLKMHVDVDNFNFCLQQDVDQLWSDASQSRRSELED